MNQLNFKIAASVAVTTLIVLFVGFAKFETNDSTALAYPFDDGFTDISVGSAIGHAKTADLDGDGNGDVIIAGRATGDVLVYFGDGEGVFTGPISYAAAAGIIDIEIADYESDGDLDVFVVNSIANNFMIFTNDGTGALTLTQTTTVSANPVDVIPGNFDGDSLLDVATISGFPGLNELVITMDDLTQQIIAQSDASSDVVAADFDGDGDDDLAVTVNNASGAAPGDLLIYTNTGGTFALATTKVTAAHPRKIAVGNFDTDSDLDMIVVSRNGQSIEFFENTGGFTFTGSTLFSPGYDQMGIDASDLDGNGALDIAVVQEGTDTLVTYLNDGSANFTQDDSYALPTIANWSVHLGDIVGSSDVEAIVRNATGVRVFLDTVAKSTTPPSRPSSLVRIGCRDKKANNFSLFARHDPLKCTYGEIVEEPEGVFGFYLEPNKETEKGTSVIRAVTGFFLASKNTPQSKPVVDVFVNGQDSIEPQERGSLVNIGWVSESVEVCYRVGSDAPITNRRNEIWDTGSREYKESGYALVVLTSLREPMRSNFRFDVECRTSQGDSVRDSVVIPIMSDEVKGFFVPKR